ncbi:MAG: hypothetical protein ACRC1M_05025 [Methanobacteriaceae archaeon]
MKENDTSLLKIGKYNIYHKNSKRGWAITIMPINFRIDNFHGFPHIHFSLKGEHNPIRVNNFNEALIIVINHISNNDEINKKKLMEELL